MVACLKFIQAVRLLLVKNFQSFEGTFADDSDIWVDCIIASGHDSTGKIVMPFVFRILQAAGAYTSAPMATASGSDVSSALSPFLKASITEHLPKTPRWGLENS